MRLVLLLLICGVLFVVVSYDTFFGGNTDTSKVVASVRPSQPGNNRPKETSDKEAETSVKRTLGNPYKDLELSSLSATVERPLFTKSRRAPAPPAQKIAVPRFIKKPKKKEADYFLMGILKNGTRAIALLREKETGKYYRVEKGDIFGSNRVTEVFAKSIQMERNDGTSQRLELKFTK